MFSSILDERLRSLDIVLMGVVGSQAYGLVTKDSDIDYRGIYVASLEEFLGLQKPPETLDIKDPDTVIYEIEKFFRLALRCNPNITEMLFLDQYMVLGDVGKEIIAHRDAFLSQKAFTTYRGYALSQLQKVRKGFEAEKVRYKDTRHCLRLLNQGRQLLETGKLTVRVDNPEFYFSLEGKSLPEIEEIFFECDNAYENIDSVLPKEPDYQRVNELLLEIRLGRF